MIWDFPYSSDSITMNHEESVSPLLGQRNEKFKLVLPTTKVVTTTQIQWVVMHTIISLLICFGVNFGLSAIAFYGHPTPTLWDWPTPMAGNYAVTIGLEVTLNWFINGWTMSLDVLGGKVAPISPEALYYWPKSEYWLNVIDICELTLPKQAHRTTGICSNICSAAYRLIHWIIYTFLTCWTTFTVFS